MPTIALAAFALVAAGQETKVTIAPVPQGITYRVDGQLFYSASSFVWPLGSKHILQFVVQGCKTEPIDTPGYQYDETCNARYSSPVWSDDRGQVDVPPVPTYVYTASQAIANIKLTAAVEYRVKLAFFGSGGFNVPPVSLPNTPCIGSSRNPGTTGVACINGSCFNQSADFWLPPGQVDLQAFPYSGFAFTGWTAGNVTTAASHLKFDTTAPVVLNPRFTQAKQVRIFTDPPELKVLVDREEVQTADPTAPLPVVCPLRGYFDFAPESLHLLAANSPQISRRDNQSYVFDSWSNGGVQNTPYRVTEVNVPETLIARFVRAINVRFFVPSGLKLIVDGRDNWPMNEFVWAAGSKHVVSAPAEQYDASGRKYILKGWTNGGPATQEITADPAATAFGLSYTIEYEKLGMLVVQSNSSGISVSVDGTECRTPCTVHTPINKPVRLTAPESIPVREGERLEFQGWTDGSPTQRTVQLGSEPLIVSAAYRSMFRLAAASDPPNAASFRMDPVSDDSYYALNTRVQVFSTAQPGFKFQAWRGDAVGAFSPVTVTVGGPRSIIAVYDPVPHIPAAGVRNAAAPDLAPDGVAAGSLVSIFGSLLADGAEQSSSESLLPQSLAGSTVEVEGSVLPLLMVSPDQINAQLPADLPEGTHKLRVRSRSLSQAVTAEFNVVRNAPGIFTSIDGTTVRVVAMATDGSSITSARPARPGDVVMLIGTGFGPCRNQPPEGFGVKEKPEYTLTDPVEVLMGDTVLQPIYVGAGADMPGVIVVRFRIPASITPADQEVFVTVNGVPSNKAWLSIRSTIMPSQQGVENQ